MVEVLVAFVACVPGIIMAQAGGSDASGGPLVFIGVGLIFAALLGLGIFNLVLFCHGKSIGKKLFGITVHDCATGLPAGFLKTFLRELLPNLVSCVPVVGVLITLIDLLFIFSSDRRRLVDKICDTVVAAD